MITDMRILSAHPASLPTIADLNRSTLEVIKVAAAAIRGAIHGIVNAYKPLLSVGAPTAAMSAFVAVVIQSGKVNSIPFVLYQKYIGAPLLNFAPNSSLLQQAVKFGEKCANSSPSAWFLSGLIQRPLIHECFSKHCEAGKEGQELAEKIETAAVKWGFVDAQKEKSTEATAASVAKIAARISSLATISFFGLALSYGLDPASYEKNSLLQYAHNSLVQPVQDLLKSYAKA